MWGVVGVRVGVCVCECLRVCVCVFGCMCLCVAVCLCRWRQSRRIGGGSAAYHAKSSSLPDGPRNAEEFSTWPTDVIKNILMCQSPTFDRESAARIRRCQNAFGSGLVLHTDYSGMGCPETMLQMMSVGFKEMGIPLVEGGTGDASDWLIVWANCDNNNLCRKVLLGRGGASKPQHFFHSMLDKVHPRLREKISQLRPDSKAPKPEKAEAFARMQTMLSKQGHRFCHRLAKSQCLIHEGVQCPLFWQDPEEALPSQRPLTVNVSGPICTPWSATGLQMGFADDNTEAWLIWLEFVKGAELDITLLENSPKMPVEHFVVAMEPRCKVLHATFGPEDSRHTTSSKGVWVS